MSAVRFRPSPHERRKQQCFRLLIFTDRFNHCQTSVDQGSSLSTPGKRLSALPSPGVAAREPRSTIFGLLSSPRPNRASWAKTRGFRLFSWIYPLKMVRRTSNTARAWSISHKTGFSWKLADPQICISDVQMPSFGPPQDRKGPNPPLSIRLPGKWHKNWERFFARSPGNHLCMPLCHPIELSSESLKCCGQFSGNAKVLYTAL